jgi:hypothetical protein
MTMIDAAARRETPELRELMCRSCGYGVSVQSPPETCPMCRTVDPWTARERPLTGYVAGLFAGPPDSE